MGMTFLIILVILTYVFPGYKAGEGTLEADLYAVFEYSLTF